MTVKVEEVKLKIKRFSMACIFLFSFFLFVGLFVYPALDAVAALHSAAARELLHGADSLMMRLADDPPTLQEGRE